MAFLPGAAEKVPGHSRGAALQPFIPGSGLVLDNGEPRAIQVMIGVGDGKFTVLGRGYSGRPGGARRRKPPGG